MLVCEGHGNGIPGKTFVLFAISSLTVNLPSTLKMNTMNTKYSIRLPVFLKTL